MRSEVIGEARLAKQSEAKKSTTVATKEADFNVTYENAPSTDAFRDGVIGRLLKFRLLFSSLRIPLCMYVHYTRQFPVLQ
jgi:hypothetical protein